MDPILDTIDEALRRAGLSDSAASKLAVGNNALLKNMRSARGDDKRYSFQALEQLARVLGLECYFGPKRQFGGFSEDALDSDVARSDALRSGFTPIPWHPSQGQTGSFPVALHSTWLAENGLIPDFLQGVRPALSSLSFAAAKHTVAVIQTNAARKGNGGVWCYREGRTIGIAQTAFASGIAVLIPRSETEEARIVSKESSSTIEFLGKVVWIGLLTDD
jgi:hypothetical protein